MFLSFKNSISRLVRIVKSVLKGNLIFINGFIKTNKGSIVHNNWGDDINILFFENISDLTILVRNTSFLYKLIPCKSYSCIGSILGFYNGYKLHVWGSGFIDEEAALPKPPKWIHSVRGPLTRKALLDKGISCPESYGDPALLISRYYQPNVVKKYKFGVIPHYNDENNSFLCTFLANHSDVLLIKMSEYDNWRDIPNKICSCNYIISSSLHGLIVSDSYGIPNLWVKFSGHIRGGGFKYLDYFASVGRSISEPFLIEDLKNLEDIIENLNLFTIALHIDFDSIYEACPFKDKLIDYRKKT